MAKDITKGSILPQLTTFAIPLILGNLFQILYNAADSIIVGQFVGDNALAAVGTAGPIMNMAILFISHNLNVVRKLCSRVAVMQGGHLVEEGLVEEIFRHPRHEYTKRLIAAIPTRDKKLN